MATLARKMKGIEDQVVDFLLKHYLIIFAVIATVLALFVRYQLRGYISSDYTNFLEGWYYELKSNGGLKALAHYPGDYNAPYMTIMALLTYLPLSPLIAIKAMSVVFDFILAIAAAYFVYTLTGLKKQERNNRWFLAIITYIVVLFLPQVLANGAYWGQCDSIYASFCILALAFLFRQKYTTSFIFLGLAFAFKLQFMFILPIFIIIYLKQRKFSIIHFLIIPLVDYVLCIPALLAGKPLMECVMVYLNQTQTYTKAMSMNYINFWSIFSADPNFWYGAGAILTLIVCAVAIAWIIHSKIELTNEKLLELALWFMVVMMFMLPGMHERYMFVGEILSVVYFIVYRKHGLLMLMLNAYALIMYSGELVHITGYEFNVLAPDVNFFNYHLLALVELGILGKFTKDVYEIHD